jgi:hypothetical protein
MSMRYNSKLFLILLLVALLAAFLASVGQASATGGRTPEEQALVAAQRASEKQERAASKASEREQHAAQKAREEEERAAIAAAEKSRRETERRAARTQAEADSDEQPNERHNGVVSISCTQVTWQFRNFEAGEHVVTEKLTIDRQAPIFSTFTFNGTGASDVTPIQAPPGTYKIDAEAKWKKGESEAKGSFDIPAKVTCVATPGLSVEKLQAISGGGGYTTTQLSGQVGQTVDYEIVARNTGNVALTLGVFSDPRCDAGTITGGPTGPLAVGDSTDYFCTHVLDAADLAAGSPYANVVSLTGTPLTQAQGDPVTETSNTVETKVIPPTVEKTTITNTVTSTVTTGAPTPASGTLAASATQAPAPKSGVLAFSSTTVPGLKGPQGCFRGDFHVSVRSAGVASVTFYLDGHKLRTLTAKNARKGLLSLTVDPARLRVGAHKLMAKITMVKATATAAAVHASRTMTVVRCRSAVLTPKFTG